MIETTAIALGLKMALWVTAYWLFSEDFRNAV